MKLHKTVKVWKKTHKLAKIVSAHLGESFVYFMDRIVREEAKYHGIGEPKEKNGTRK